MEREWINAHTEHLYFPTSDLSGNIGNYYYHRLYGYFVAPATTRYRFYQTCDDKCHLRIDLNGGGSRNDLSWLTSVTGWMPQRQWFVDRTDKGVYRSHWVNLVEGQEYYFES